MLFIDLLVLFVSSSFDAFFCIVVSAKIFIEPSVQFMCIFKNSSSLSGNCLWLSTTVFKSLNKLSDVQLDSVKFPYLKIGTIMADQHGINLQKSNKCFAIFGQNCMLSRSPVLLDS
ncbi:Uncharacterized protein FWK35_00038170 [Aphis craccivora]|uniref:Uncharacterized protein n=1 Tax=Aphis craccivora TaxID=307492 RepID=A0A6G0VNB0_APHCR|nr:Uncharacterized protein FWK35_00038170 [Aphis craccivora]